MYLNPLNFLNLIFLLCLFNMKCILHPLRFHFVFDEDINLPGDKNIFTASNIALDAPFIFVPFLV